MDEFIAHPKLMMGGVRSFKYSPMYDALTERLDATRMEQVGDLETLYRMFAHGRFDATIASPLAYRFYLEKHPPLETAIYGLGSQQQRCVWFGSIKRL